MLGEQIGEGRGKRTGRRVLSTDGGGFKVEVSFEETGKVLGFDIVDIGTYWSSTRPDGTLYGEGQGVVLSPDGGMATWKGAGVGKIATDGSISYRGAIYFTTSTPKFARLNFCATLFEFDVDPQGNTHSKNWEWK